MIWFAAFVVFMLTVMTGVPALVGAGVFGELMGEPDLRLAVSEQGIDPMVLVLLAAVGVLPSLLSGLLSGGFAFAVARRVLPAADPGPLVAAAGGALVLHLAVAPLLFPETALMPKVVQVTGALIAYAVAAMAMGDLDEEWRLRLRRAWVLLLALAMVECAAFPLIVMGEPQ